MALGWVSLIEDIRNEREHFRKGLAGIRVKVRNGVSSFDPNRAKPWFRALRGDLTSHLHEIETRVLAVFDEAEIGLKDSRVNLVQRVDREARELETMRATLAEQENQLSKCRAARAELQKEVEALRAENKRLVSENSKIRDNELAWAQELGQVRPIEKR
jgi:hypothetical protein